jgi:alpha-tubulin suppressor-like RCC1 family protein/Tfp pilus assembly protein PilE
MKLRRAFTIVEIAAVISVLAVITAITIVGYGNWRNRAAVNDVKNELTLAAAAMKAELATNNAYPSSVSGSYKPGLNVTVSYMSGDASSYCLEGVSKTVTSIRMFIKNTDLVPSMGTCGTGSIASIDPNTGMGTSGKVWIDFDVSNYGTCALDYGGYAYCWGRASNGGLGNNTSSGNMNKPTPVYKSGVLNGLTVQSISVGSPSNEETVCAIASDSKLYCWGSDNGGLLGNSAVTTNSLVPISIDTSGLLSGKSILKSKVGLGPANCVVASDNKIYCWGTGTVGQLGQGAYASSEVPVAVVMTGALSGKTIKDFGRVSTGMCVLASDDKPYCWGYGAYGTNGNGSTSSTNVPVAVTMSGILSGKTVKLIGGKCVVASDDAAYCWGAGTSGQLGNGGSIDSSVPVAVDTSGVLSGKTIKDISGWSSSSCALDSSGNAYCWGDNSHGQLGNNTTTSSTVPVAVTMNGLSFTRIETSGGHTCALATTSKLYCWGWNTDSQLGDGTATQRLVPTLVSEP